MARRAAPRPLRFFSPLHRASRQLSVHLERRVRDLGVPYECCHALAYLASYGPCPVGDLRRVFGTSLSTLTGILDRLEAGSLITRAMNPADRRSVLVEVTPEGRRRAARLRKILDAVEAEIDGRISAGERKGFERVMAAIAAVTRVEVRPGRESGDSREEKP